MSTSINAYRARRTSRIIFREGRFLLNTEGMEIQLQALGALREKIKKAFGDYTVVEGGFKVEVDPSNSSRLIIRPGTAFIDGYDLRIQSGKDHLVNTGLVPVDFDPSDFIKVDASTIDPGGVVLNFGGVTSVATGSYAIVMEAREELITAADDPYYRSVNLNENTAERHRIILNVNIIDVTDLDKSPIPYKGSAVGNLVNEVEITRSGAAYSLLGVVPITGTEIIDGRNIEALFDNGNGTTTAAFPVSNTDLAEYIHGSLIDSNGTEFHITDLIVTPGSSNRITMTLDLEKTRPVASATFQDNPVILDGVAYKLVKRDLFVTNASSLPEGKRFFNIANVVWGGASFASVNITDKRPHLLAYDGVLSRIQNDGLKLYSDAEFTWFKDQDSGTLLWNDTINIHSTFDNFEWSVAAGDTFSLFSEALAQNEVLYVRLTEKPLGGVLTLLKGIRGQGDLEPKSIEAYKVYWIAKRHVDDRVYFNSHLILNDEQTDTIHPGDPERVLPQDILTLGFQATWDDDLYNTTGINPTSSTGYFFARSYLLDYSNRTINVAGNNVTLGSVCSFTVQVGDVIVQAAKYTLVTNVTSQTDFDVADGSQLTDSQNATIGQILETFNVRALGDNPEDRIEGYISDTITKALVTYDDAVLQAVGNTVKVGFSVTADNTNYTDVIKRQEAFTDFTNQFDVAVAGLDYRLRFFPVITTGDGTATLEDFRTFIHNRTFVGTILPAIASAGSPVGAASATLFPPVTNNTGGVLAKGKVVRVETTGLVYASANTPANAEPTIGVLISDIDPGDPTEVVGNGLAQGVLTGKGFSAKDQIFLGVNGDLVNEAAVLAFPPGYVQKELGVALNNDDMWVQIDPLEIL